MSTIDGQTFEQWAKELFADEYCAECLGDERHHEPWVVMGHWFARCHQWRVDLICEAEGLASEDGENPEYDRALVELVIRSLGLNDNDDRDMVAAAILHPKGVNT